MALMDENRSALLRRVQEAEEMEVPSLPSFTHDLDDDDETDDVYYGRGGGTSGHQDGTEEDLSTPHVARYRSPPLTGATIVPRQRTPIEEPTPLARRDPRDLSPDGYTSTPYAEQLRLSQSRRNLTRSTDTRQFGKPTHTWEGDASSQQLPELPDVDDLPEPTFAIDPSVTSESIEVSIMDTPVPRAFAIKRPSPVNVTAPGTAPDSRIPSLSRSEVSGTDNEATTPDGPHRFLEQIEEATHDYPTHEYNTTVASVSPPSESEHMSPLKSDSTPSAIRFMDMPNTVARAAATPFTTHMIPLHDATPKYRNRDRETTPSPGKTPGSEYATPRGGIISEADRRKSHVLTVLSTAKMPSRFKTRGTPHPARRVSLAPDATSIIDEGNSTSMIDQSFLSIASSQDLTMDRRGSRLHQRGNTSVPNIVLGTGTAASPGGPENRAEFVKIGKHTNMMNSALHEENTRLAMEVQDWQDEYAWLTEELKAKGVEIKETGEIILPAGLSQSTSSNRSSSSSATQRQRFEALEEDLHRKDGLIADLEKKLQSGGGDVTTLEKERDEAVAALDKLEGEFAHKTQAHAAQFTEICADYEAQVGELTTELDKFKKETDELKHECDALQTERDEAREEARSGKAAAAASNDDEINSLKDKIAHLETELDHAREDADAADAEAEQARGQLADIENDKEGLLDQLQTARDEAARLRDELDGVHNDESEQVAELKKRISEVEDAKYDAVTSLEAATARMTDLQAIIEAKEEQIVAQRETIVELEQQVDERAEEETALRREIADLESELDTARHAVADKDADIATLQSALDVAGMAADKTMDTSVIQALQDRLGDAHHEIEHLKAELEAVPERKQALETRDVRIKALETEKEALQDRLRTKDFAPSPMRSMVTSTPIVNRVLANLRTPKTPGPMKEFSWLQTTIGDSNESILRSQLEHLQQDLDSANALLDKNFHRIEAAGLGSVTLAEELVRAKHTIKDLEDQIRQLARNNKQSVASLNLDRSRNERLENALDSIHEQMSQLKGDTEREKERLKEELRRVRASFRDLQAKAEEEIEELGGQIVEIRRDADDKAADVDEQVISLRADKDLLTKNLKAARATIARLETDIQSLQQANNDAKRENQRLKDTASAASRSQEMLRSVQDKLREAQLETDKIRQTLRERNRSLETADNRIDDLKAERERITRELVAFGEDLTAQRRECARFGTELEALRHTGNSEASQAKSEMASLESDLRWTRERLETATRQAKAAEREYAEVERRALEAERRVVDVQTTSADKAAASRASQAEAAAAAAADAAAETRQKYKIQTRRLAAQIEYLKALYARENTFRNALALQKKFLLLLVGGLSLNEQATLRAIASMGLPVPAPPRPRCTLKAVGIAVIATIRARRMAEAWRMQKESRSTSTRRS